MKTKSEAETKTDGATLKPTDSLVCSLDKNIKPESVGLPFNGQENNVMSQKSENAGSVSVKYRIEWQHNGQWKMDYAPVGVFGTRDEAVIALTKPEYSGLTTRIVEVR